MQDFIYFPDSHIGINMKKVVYFKRLPQNLRFYMDDDTIIDISNDVEIRNFFDNFVNGG